MSKNFDQYIKKVKKDNPKFDWEKSGFEYFPIQK